METIIALVIVFVALIISSLVMFFLSKMKHLENEFGNLLKIVGSLKFKQFEHEAQLLNRAGVYVPEDSAQFVFNIMWSMIGKKEKEYLEAEYSQKCPKHIPIWKFVLHNYKIDVNVMQKEPLMKMSRTEDILSTTYELEKITESFTKTQENMEARIASELRTNSLMTDAIKVVTEQVNNIEEEIKATNQGT